MTIIKKAQPTPGAPAAPGVGGLAGGQAIPGIAAPNLSQDMMHQAMADIPGLVERVVTERPALAMMALNHNPNLLVNNMMPEAVAAMVNNEEFKQQVVQLNAFQESAKTDPAFVEWMAQQTAEGIEEAV